MRSVDDSDREERGSERRSLLLNTKIEMLRKPHICKNITKDPNYKRDYTKTFYISTGTDSVS